MTQISASMKRRRLQGKVGRALSIWCVVFGLLHILWIQSFTVTIVPSVSGRDTPDASVTILSIVSGVVLLGASWLSANLSDDQPSVLIGRFSMLKQVVLLVLSLVAVVRVVLGLPRIVSGDAPVMAIVAEVWFLVAAVAGLVLWVTLLKRKRDLRR